MPVLRVNSFLVPQTKAGRSGQGRRNRELPSSSPAFRAGGSAAGARTTGLLGGPWHPRTSWFGVGSSCQTSGDAGAFWQMECEGIVFSGSVGNSALEGFGGRCAGVSGWKCSEMLLPSSPCSEHLLFRTVALLGRSREC